MYKFIFFLINVFPFTLFIFCLQTEYHAKKTRTRNILTKMDGCFEVQVWKILMELEQ